MPYIHPPQMCDIIETLANMWNMWSMEYWIISEFFFTKCVRKKANILWYVMKYFVFQNISSYFHERYFMKYFVRDIYWKCFVKYFCAIFQETFCVIFTDDISTFHVLHIFDKVSIIAHISQILNVLLYCDSSHSTSLQMSTVNSTDSYWGPLSQSRWLVAAAGPGRTRSTAAAFDSESWSSSCCCRPRSPRFAGRAGAAGRRHPSKMVSRDVALLCFAVLILAEKSHAVDDDVRFSDSVCTVKKNIGKDVPIGYFVKQVNPYDFFNLFSSENFRATL